MTIFARRLPTLTGRTSLRRLLASAGPLAAVVVGLLLSAAPAGAVVTTVEGTSVGLQPRTESLTEGNPETFANNSGNPIVDGASVYAVYWDPTKVFNTHHEWLTNLDQFFQRLGAGSGSLSTVFSTLGQYRDRANQQAAYSTVFKGSYSDTVKYPTAGCTDPEPLAFGAKTCLTDAQLREQLQAFVATHGLQKGMNTIYDVITPPGVTVCLDAAATHCSDFSVSAGEESKGEHKSASFKNSFCSYHGDINPDAAPVGDGNTILYAAVPWTAAGTLGAADEVSNARVYAEGETCQDGGWNPSNREENREEPRELTAAEEKAHENDTPKQEAELVEELRLEGPHQEEPNQEGKGEAGDYSPGLSDLIVNQVAEEQANIVTDPLLNAWHDSEGHEVTDECRNAFDSTAGGVGIEGSVTANTKTQAGTLFNTEIGESEGEPGASEIGAGHYYVNNVYSLSGNQCVGGVGILPRFTAPNPVNANEIVGFDGLESSVSLLEGAAFGPSGPPTVTYATFTWNFGDGTEVSGYIPDAPPCEAPWLSPCAASAFHSYQYGGTYHVTLTVTDVAGNRASVEHDVTVTGPAAPVPATTPTTPPAAPSTGAPTTKVGPGGTPVATAVVLSHSLKAALRKGLSVGYSVDEQVAGHFEVLIARTLAHKLKLSGAAATGLPTGTPAQVVIAKAILVTTKSGHSVFKIKFSKSVASRLAHAHSAPLMLRLIVRGAASRGTAVTTVVSTVTLKN